MSTLLVIFSALAFFGVGWWLLCKCRLPLEKTVLAAVLVLSLLSSLIMIPGSVPDETAHIQTAYRYANALLLKPYSTENGGMLVRRDDVSLNRFSRYTTPGRSSYGEVLDSWKWFCTGEGAEMVTEENMRNVRTGFAAYLPQAVGMAIARILHLGTWPMLYVGRLFSAVTFVGMLWLAVRIAPVKKPLFAMLGLIPTCIQSAGSLSYDMMIIGMTVLFTAYFLHLIYTREHIGLREWILCTLAAILLFPCKFIYSSIFFMLFLVPASKWGSGWKKALFLCVVAAAGFASFLGANLSRVTEQLATAGSETGQNVLTHVEVYSTGWLLSHPVSFIQMIFQSLREYSDFYWKGMFINRLIRFDNTVNWALVVMLCCFLAAMRHEQDELEIPLRHKPLFAAAVGLTFVAAMVFMIVDYTAYGSLTIEGFQGRYLTPMLPLILLVLGSRHVRVSAYMQRWLAAALIGANGGAMVDMVKWFMSNPF